MHEPHIHDITRAEFHQSGQPASAPTITKTHTGRERECVCVRVCECGRRYARHSADSSERRELWTDTKIDTFVEPLPCSIQWTVLDSGRTDNLDTSSANTYNLHNTRTYARTHPLTYTQTYVRFDCTTFPQQKYIRMHMSAIWWV